MINCPKQEKPKHLHYLFTARQAEKSECKNTTEHIINEFLANSVLQYSYNTGVIDLGREMDVHKQLFVVHLKKNTKQNSHSVVFSN